ncbi:MAG: hypothetical protein NC342_01785 [Pseudoflavonifractor sp.]|nr:hypothetical protein [Alloprevotella sp.]MCM1116254.1 hypothetical protein [Pseudoflavonifractor sp.]
MVSIDSVEFYVMAAVAAAAVVGLCVRPSSKGEARQTLLEGELLPAAEGDDEYPAGVAIRVLDDGRVEICRKGLAGLVNADGEVSVAVTVAGFDILVEERLTPGRGADQDAPSPSQARFILDGLGRERYHLRYSSETIGSMAATSLHVKPGISIFRSL